MPIPNYDQEIEKMYHPENFEPANETDDGDEDYSQERDIDTADLMHDEANEGSRCPICCCSLPDIEASHDCKTHSG
jgi:hypothetical protein